MPPKTSAVVKPVPLPPAAVPAPAKVAKDWPSATTPYVVKQGDYLSTIASKFHVSVAEIMALNGISDPNKVRVGQTLILPGKLDIEETAPAKKTAPTETKKPAPAAKPAAAVTPPASAPAADAAAKKLEPVAAADGSTVHEVKPGDMLAKIASKYGVTADAIRTANSLKGDKIMVGQKLKIPAPSPVPAAAALAVKPVDTAKVPAPVATPPKTGSVPPTPPVPPVAEPLTPAPAADPAAAVPAPGTSNATKLHTVQANEDLYSVAMMWGVSVAELKEVNGLADTTLKEGQVLKIPVRE
jgi:LysM repeat protein